MSLVLIGNASALSAPEVAWSLLDAGHEVVAFGPEADRSILRYEPRVRLVSVTDPADDAARAVTDVARLVRDLAPAATLALDDRALWLLAAADHGSTARTAPVGSALEVAFDKAEQLRLARAAGFEVPPTTVVGPGHEGPLDFPGAGPWIVKPAEAVTLLDGRLVKGDLSRCSTQAEVRQAVAELGGPALVQQVLVGTGTGVFGLVGPDGVVGWSGHERVRMMHPLGSGASAARSVVPGPDLRSRVSRFLQDAGWTGMFMVELLRRPDGSVVFMELNGRCWGSMALARRQGLEYPAWAVAQALGEPVEATRPEPGHEVTVRHLGREIVHALHGTVARPKRAPDSWPTRAEALQAVAGWGGTDGLYNWQRGRTRLWLADTWRTVYGQVRPPGERRRVTAAVHVHSEWSYDAAWKLTRLRQVFERRGYGAVLLCEHDLGFDQVRFDAFREACAAASSPGCVLVPGIEYSDAENAVHVPVWGTERFLGEGRPTTETLSSVVEAGAVAILAHPGRRHAADRWEPEWAEGLVGIEVWNHKYDGMAPNRRASALAAEAGLPAFASLDFHRRRQLGPLRMRLLTTSRSPEAVVGALRDHRVSGAYGPVPLTWLTDGPGRSVLGLVEGARKPLARTGRRALARVRAAQRGRRRKEAVGDR